jgi:hypothetical protein
MYIHVCIIQNILDNYEYKLHLSWPNDLCERLINIHTLNNMNKLACWPLTQA